MNRTFLLLATLLPMVSLACDIDDTAGVEARSGTAPTTFVGGPGNIWTEGTPYLSYYIDLRCDPVQGCEAPPDFDTVLYDFTSAEPLEISGATDADNGLPNGVTYEKHVAGGDWVPLAAPYTVTLNEPYLDGEGNQAMDDAFRIKRQIPDPPWSLVNSRWETSSTWVRFPHPNGDPYTPDFDLTYTLQACGNGGVEGTEACDDGNTQDGDGCSSACTIEPAVCGDGVVQSDEECDDGNDIGDDGCEFCESKTSQGLVYARAGSLFSRFSESTNSWTSRANLPAASNTTLTNDGQYVYTLSMAEAGNVPDPNKRNHIFKYDATNNTWTDHITGPGYTLGGNGLDMLEWVGDGFVFLNNWRTNQSGTISDGVEVWSYHDSAWELMANIPNIKTWNHGGWDRASNRLHVTFFHVTDASKHGVLTIETGETFGTSLSYDPYPMTPSSLPNGSFSQGSFFRWQHAAYEMRRYSPSNWSYTGAGQYISANVAATDHADGDIFLLRTDGIPNSFHRYSVEDNSLTPLSVPSIGTPVLTVMRPL